MWRANGGFERHLDQFRNLVPVALLLASGILNHTAMAQVTGQTTFAAPAEASEALYRGAQNNDTKELLEIFGPGGKDILYSGDEAEDAESRTTFVRGYEEMHRLVQEPNGTVTLYIGARNWPVPIPIVKIGDAWYFDTESGKREILFRRIGRNEISAIHICRQLAAAEEEFKGQRHEYAQNIFSETGQHNGLYWEVAQGEPESPIGPLVAEAVAEGYKKNGDAPVPYRGYFFRILTRQGKSALGGAKSYIVGGKMTQGFAFMAYPAEYGSSGVKTFLVGRDGIVFENDLGKNTDAIARAMTQFNPESSWQRAEDQQELP